MKDVFEVNYEKDFEEINLHGRGDHEMPQGEYMAFRGLRASLRNKISSGIRSTGRKVSHALRKIGRKGRSIKEKIKMCVRVTLCHSGSGPEEETLGIYDLLVPLSGTNSSRAGNPVTKEPEMKAGETIPQPCSVIEKGVLPALSLTEDQSRARDMATEGAQPSTVEAEREIDAPRMLNVLSSWAALLGREYLIKQTSADKAGYQADPESLKETRATNEIEGCIHCGMEEVPLATRENSHVSFSSSMCEISSNDQRETESLLGLRSILQEENKPCLISIEDPSDITSTSVTEKYNDEIDAIVNSIIGMVLESMKP